jgi:hypothetical protein
LRAAGDDGDLAVELVGAHQLPALVCFGLTELQFGRRVNVGILLFVHDFVENPFPAPRLLL